MQNTSRALFLFCLVYFWFHHHVIRLLTSLHRFTLSFLAQIRDLHPHLIAISYRDYVTVERFRSSLDYCDTTQHRHRRTSATGGDASAAGYHFPYGYDSWHMPFSTTCQPGIPAFQNHHDTYD